MSVDLRYGVSNSLTLEFSSDQTTAFAGLDVETIDGSLKEVIHASLDQAIHFPAFREIVFPEDTLAIAIGEGIPRIAEILASLIDYIQTYTEVALEDITIVFPNELTASVESQLKELLDEFVFSTLTFELHNPAISEELAYLTATQEGEPIRLNKTLVDADVVLPICSNLPESLFGYAGFFHDLFPLYTETETILRFRSNMDIETLRRDSIEAANMLGIQYLLKVTPANGEAIHNIAAGDIFTLQKSVPSIATGSWSYSISESELTIGSLSGTQHQQTWDNLARALSTLAKATSMGGAIIICSQLSGPLPGPIKLLNSNDAQQQLGEQVKLQPDVDIQAAQEILNLRSDYHIYLLSDLNGEDVESIGLAHIESPAQINNLIAAARKVSCVADAHRVAVT